MTLGFLTNEYKDSDVVFAAEIGFDCLEINVDYNTALSLDKINDADIESLMRHFESNGVSVGTVACSLNLLDGDLEVRERNIKYMEKMIAKVKQFGTDIITTNVWGNNNIKPVDNIPLFKEVYSPIADLCEREGVRIGFENCPHFIGYPLYLGNIGYSPEMFNALFDVVESDKLGLEFDPSHLYWLGIDYLAMMREFSGKIFAVHAKDTEIIPENQYKYGTIGRQIGPTSIWDAGWWRYRIPGWGHVNWQEIYKTIYDINFNGPIIIEHEDPVFDNELRPVGLKMGHDYLRQFDLPVL